METIGAYAEPRQRQDDCRLRQSLPVSIGFICSGPAARPPKWSQTLSTCPETPRADLLKAEALFSMGQGDKAIAVVEEMLRRQPPAEIAADANRLLIDLARRCKDTAKAKQTVDHVLAGAPSSVFGLIDAALVEQATGNPAGATARLDAARDCLPRPFPVRGAVGLAAEYFQAGHFSDAARIYE